MMKKSLIALALVAAAPVAFAATSNVDIYGQVRVSVDKADTAGAVWNMADQASRIGVKGTEDLGGGMSAVYGMEWGVAVGGAATGGSTTAGSTDNITARNQFVGLKGSFGTVLAGRHDTPYKLAGSADLFGDTAADAQGSKGIIGRVNFDLRANNALAYISPDVAGFHAAVAVTNNGGAEELGEAQSLALVYVNGPLKATYGYESHGAVTTGDESAQKVNVSYKMGDLGVGATYEQKEVAAADRNAYLVSVSYGMGPITLAAQTGTVDLTATTELKRTTVGAIYALSKRTNAYIGYQMEDNAGTDTNTTTIGLNHSF
jgi:predicted porin